MKMERDGDTTIFQHDGKASSRSGSAPKRYPANGRKASIIQMMVYCQLKSELAEYKVDQKNKKKHRIEDMKQQANKQ